MNIGPAVTFQQINPYQKWLEKENIPAIHGSLIDDVTKVELHPWPRTGGRGVYLDLGGAELTGAYICEISPGGSLKPEKHLFEELIYIVSGAGTTLVWTKDTPKQSFDWQEGSIFSPPLNTLHQLSNSSKDKPVRFFAVTGAYVYMNLFHSFDFIFNSDTVFKDRYAGQKNYFNEAGRLLDISGRPVWEGNFIRDARNFELPVYERMGKGHRLLNLALSDNTMEAHISEFETGTYKKAHCTDFGAHLIVSEGEGYSLMWTEGQPKERFDWHRGSIIAPRPAPWFHQHFITGVKNTRQVAFRWGGRKYRFGQDEGADTDRKKGGGQIEYWDEDPEVRQMFEAELAKKGLKSKIDASLYRRPEIVGRHR